MCANCISGYNNGTDMVYYIYFYWNLGNIFSPQTFLFFTVKQKQVTKILDDCSEKLKQHQEELECADKEEE